MTTPDESAHRLRYRATGDDVTVREPDEVEGGEDVFEIRMPIASTGEVRNEGDEPLTRGELDGMARQLSDRQIGVFPAHGDDDMIATGRYSPFERLGDWQAAEIESREDEDLLMATARMPDPETLPQATGSYREALAILKEQATRGIAQDASIGWRTDEDAPGGNDLMEASIVGIGADPRTNTGDESAAVVARAAVDAGADPNALVSKVRDAVRESPEDARPFGPPNAPNLWEDFDECVADVEDWENVDDAEAFCAWAQEQTESADADTDTQDMTDDDPGGDDSGTTDEEQSADDTDTERVSDAEYREQMLDLQNQQMELLSTLAERVTDEDDDDMDEEDDDEDDEGEMNADGDDVETQDTDDDRGQELADEVASLREQLDEFRAGDGEVETPGDGDGDETERDADGAGDDETEQRDTDDDADAATAGPNWRSD